MMEVLYNSNLKSTNRNGDVLLRKRKMFLVKKANIKIPKEAIRKARRSKMLKLIFLSDNKRKLRISFCRSIDKLPNQSSKQERIFKKMHLQKLKLNSLGR